jgi:hypothetical protein
VIHFIGSARAQSGKSWFVRVLAEIMLQQDPRTIVVDTSGDKRIGKVYSPTFNRLVNICFDSHTLSLDPLLDYAGRYTLIVEIPSQSEGILWKWLSTMDLPSGECPCTYWFVSRGNEDYPSNPLELFGEKAFLVQNLHFIENFQSFLQPNFPLERTIQLSGAIRNPLHVARIESSDYTLTYQQQQSNTIDASRIYRFLHSARTQLEPILTRQQEPIPF